MDLSQVIIAPVVTEKALALEKRSVYVFLVHPRSKKATIKQAVEAYFKVKVKQVNTMRLKGKVKKTGRRRLPKKLPVRKKAFVQLEAGQKIKLLEKIKSE